MNAKQNNASGYRLGIAMVASCLAMALPLATVRADDDDNDWEDRWEDYQEDLEDYQEDLEDQREDARERWEAWHEDSEDAREDWRERHGHGGYYYGPSPAYRADRYRGRHYYDHRSAPGYRTHYWEPRSHRYYEPVPQYRFYGTPDVGYTEFGRQRSVQVGPYRVYWDRD